MSNNSLQISMASIRTLSTVIKRAYAHAQSLGYNGTSLDYAMMVLPGDTTVIDSAGYCGPLSDAPSVKDLLKSS